MIITAGVVGTGGMGWLSGGGTLVDQFPPLQFGDCKQTVRLRVWAGSGDEGGGAFGCVSWAWGRATPE